MLTKEIKKGTRVRLRNGWEAKTLNSATKTTVLCEVYGFCTEMGSVYTSDIVKYQDENGKWQSDLEYSKGQIKCREMIQKIGW